MIAASDAITSGEFSGGSPDPVWRCATCGADLAYVPIDWICEDCREKRDEFENQSNDPRR